MNLFLLPGGVIQFQAQIKFKLIQIQFQFKFITVK